MLAWLHMNRGAYEEARRLLDDSQERESSLDRRLVGDAFRGMSYALEGRSVEAERLLREVLDRIKETPDIDVAIECVAAGLLCDPLYEANELAAACQLVGPRIELLERSAIPDAVLRALLTLASVHRIAGDPLEAEATIERLEDYALRHGLDRLLVHALALRMRWQLKDGQPKEADMLLRRLGLLGEHHRGALPGTHSEIARVAERAAAQMSMHWNDFGAAADRLGLVLTGAESAGRWREVAITRMMLAVAESGRGRSASAKVQLMESLRLGHTLGLMRSLLDVSPRIPAMLEGLLDDSALDAVLAFYVRRLLAAVAETRRRFARKATSETVASSGLGGLSKREREVLDLVAQAMPNKKIALVLGVTPYTVKFHLSRIYLKLGVSQRDQAVARMRDLEGRVLPPTR